MFGRTRFQQGSLQRERRKKGPEVWVFRWYEPTPDGKRKRQYCAIGTVEQYPTESAAQAAAAALRLEINVEAPRTVWKPVSVRDLITHYEEKELNLDSVDPEEHEKAYSTKKGYRIYLENWIRPRWGLLGIKDVRTVAVEGWLKTLTLPGGRKMARGTKAKIRNIMHALFNHAIRYEWLSQNANPISKVRQSAKRERIPDVLEVFEFQALLQELSLRERTLVALDGITGLRRGELIGLKWSDIDFENLQINVTRSVVHQVVGNCKTEASQKPVPLEASVAEDLWLFKQSSPYNRPDDWVFASLWTKGKQPLWPDSLLKRWIQPAAKRVGISKRLGWHTFRHTYSTLLRANGEDVKVVQELLRHANSKITMDVYTQALSPAKREAQGRVASIIFPKKAANAVGLSDSFGQLRPKPNSGK
jgi:integrase